MFSLTMPEATVIAAVIAIFAGLVSQSLKGVGYLIERRVTGAGQDEQLERGLKIAQLLAIMGGQGASAHDVRQMGVLLRRPEIMASTANNDIVSHAGKDAEPAQYGDNHAMKARAGAAYEVAQAQLGQALGDLALLLRPDESARLEAVQGCWMAYRDALAEMARQEFDGGTHAGLAGVMTALAETERRTVEVRDMVAERGRL